MSKPKQKPIAIASSSTLATDAGARIAAAGGNAVDAAIAAVLLSMTTEPGVCSLGGGGYVTVWPPGRDPVTIDGNVEMPGRGQPEQRFGGGAEAITMDYGGGITTLVRHGSMATPGALAACDAVWQEYGHLPWRELVAPAYEAARDGFGLSQASYDYLVHSHELVYGWNADSRAALHHPDGRLKSTGDTIQVPHLADSLRRIADAGAGVFYRGEIAHWIAADSDANDGILGLRDLAEYQPERREPLRERLFGWDFATNPPPAVGGATLGAMLALLEDLDTDAWDSATVARMVNAQAAVLEYRYRELDLADDVSAAARRLFALAADKRLVAHNASAATVHTSAVDADGLCCAITMSSGYGSGVMPPGTGIWMNNSLGELELNRRGLIAGPPGTRLASNMAPSVARADDGRALAIGSPGADRITSALLQTLIGHFCLGMSLPDAIRHPRAHVEHDDKGTRVAYESGLAMDAVTLPTRSFANRSMYFGGVGAALRSADGTVLAAADPRRSGGARTIA